jgi:hypothetical protein
VTLGCSPSSKSVRPPIDAERLLIRLLECFKQVQCGERNFMSVRDVVDELVREVEGTWIANNSLIRNPRHVESKVDETATTGE